MGDIQISGAAMTVIATLFSGLVSAVVYLFRAMREGHEREKTQLRDERDHARKEAAEWKYMAMRGTDLAKFFGEKATAP